MDWIVDGPSPTSTVVLEVSGPSVLGWNPGSVGNTGDSWEGPVVLCTPLLLQLGFRVSVFLFGARVWTSRKVVQGPSPVSPPHKLLLVRAVQVLVVYPSDGGGVTKGQYTVCDTPSRHIPRTGRWTVVGILHS